MTQHLADQKTMTITVKLYASLSPYLPKHARRNQADIHVANGMTVQALCQDLGLPQEMCHLVLVNGNYIAPGARADAVLKEGDHLAAWPPVAGG